MILIDTNVVVYALNADAPQHVNCRRVLEQAATGQIPGVLLPQILIECYSVVTSPRRLRSALSPGEARAALRRLARAIEVRPVPETLMDDLDQVLAEHPRRGRDVFDLAIAAQMLTHGIRAICTCNVDDFAIPGIQALDPGQTLSFYR